MTYQGDKDYGESNAIQNFGWVIRFLLYEQIFNIIFRKSASNGGVLWTQLSVIGSLRLLWSEIAAGTLGSIDRNSRLAIPAICAVAAISASNFCNLGLKIWHSQQPKQSRYSRLAISADNIGNLYTSRQLRPATFSISACNLPFSACKLGNIGKSGNLGQH